jgi:sugar (pentulose or hexulose) kinase
MTPDAGVSVAQIKSLDQESRTVKGISQRSGICAADIHGQPLYPCVRSGDHRKQVQEA